MPKFTTCPPSQYSYLDYWQSVYLLLLGLAAAVNIPHVFFLVVYTKV